MVKPESPFYPPRARWYSRLFYGYDFLRRIFFLEALKQRTHLFLYQILLALFIPAYGPWLMGRKRLAIFLLAFYTVGLLVYLVRLGYLSGNLMYGMLIAAHAIGSVETFSQMRTDQQLSQRIKTTLATLFIMALLVYYPLNSYAQRHWFRPVLTHDRVIIINPQRKAPPVKRGEWLGFSFGEIRQSGYFIRPGLGLGPVVGLPGERIQFFADRYEIDGMVFARSEGLPETGDYQVPEGHCLIWPTLVRMDVHENMRARVMEHFMKQVALVPESHWVGRPFAWWFFRNQELP